GYLLIGLWIGTGLLVTAVFAVWRGPIYFGVALPFGSIGGLVLYLVYYALFARLPEGEEVQPFRWDRLLVTALIAAIIAHYVEIHFGIAIASTRVHFFVYLGLMFVVTQLMSRQAEEAAPVPVAPVGKGRKRSTAVAAASTAQGYGVWGPLLLNAFMLALILGTLAYSFITYNQPPDVSSVTQITPGAIFHQSMLVNAKKDFTDSPFIFLMLILTWVLGTLVISSEMVKEGELRFQPSNRKLAANRRQIALILFAVMAVVSFVARLLFPLSDSATATSLLGQSLYWVWGGLCLWAAYRLWRGEESGRLSATAVALAGLLFTIPLVIAGGWMGLGVGVVCAVLLYLLWDNAWGNSLGAVGVLTAVSLGFGLMYAYFQAFQLRGSILYGVLNPRPEDPALLQQFLVNEAVRASSMLVNYYSFVFLLLIFSAFALAISRKPPVRQNGTMPAYALLAALVFITSTAVFFTNTRVVQADIIYKRGKFYDNQASRSGDVSMWQNAIAIYEAAVNRTPREDFYYLFLGRAYLELATLLTNSDPARAEQLLNEAQDRLEDAQDINPLNTDHTANLARLNTRGISLSQDEVDRQDRIDAAEAYYLDALALSPQNSVIRNEHAQLVLSIKQDCDKAIDIYQQSLEIDPYYEETYFRLADGLLSQICVNEKDEAELDVMYADAVGTLEEGLAINPNNARAWLRLGQIYQQLERYDAAVTAFGNVRQYDPQGRVAPAWNVNLLIARVLFQKGDLAQAETLARQTLATAPEEAKPQIEQLLNQILGNDAASDALSEVETVADYELDGARPLAAIAPAQRNRYYDSYPPFVIDEAKNYEAIIHTEKGPLRFRLYTAEAPLTVNNFVYLASQGFYDGTVFHRVLENFMAQGGDPTGTGTGGPGYNFADETANGLTFDRRGLLAMANAGPNTNGSQFFVTFVPTPHLNGAHTIFGELLEGDDVLSSLTLRDPNGSPTFAGDMIERIEIVEVER
ncbi:MAG TPA: peptidylprolyl isomerase, partial [Chloroflexota bacterium]|nr:peptidylprolyl isomerase [Chloroflexota bacterium]